jgi:uncharacterized RDD family membrane protein YckC
MTTESNTQIDLGHWLLRLIALIIDGIILGIVAWILMFALFLPLMFTDALFGFWASWSYALLLPLLVGVLMVLYFLVLEVSWGGTLGKRVMGLRVQTVNGGKITYGQAFIRNISKIFWLFLLLDWLIAIATAGTDRRQKYTDRMAGTTVAQTRQPFESIIPSQQPSA